MSEEIVGIIGGSGLGSSLASHIEDVELKDVDTPFGKTSSPVMTGRLGDRAVAFIDRHGIGHRIGPSDVPYAANIFGLKTIGVKTIIASGAVGSLRDEICPKELVIVDQAIDKTYRRQSSFFDSLGAVHCEFALPFCSRLRNSIIKVAEGLDIKTHDKGTYVCMEGPQFSTRAESLMHRAWGGDLIGMTLMPEAKLAREAQICYSMISLVSDYDCWMEHNAQKDKQTLLAEIRGNLEQATENAITLIKAVLESGQQLSHDPCPCRKSLELAVWTEPARISPVSHEILKPLFD